MDVGKFWNISFGAKSVISTTPDAKSLFISPESIHERMYCLFEITNATLIFLSEEDLVIVALKSWSLTHTSTERFLTHADKAKHELSHG